MIILTIILASEYLERQADNTDDEEEEETGDGDQEDEEGADDAEEEAADDGEPSEDAADGDDGEATTDDLVKRFKDKLPAKETPLFKALLQQIASFVRDMQGRGVWRLKSEFR